MLGQITQLFADEDRQGRKLMTEYLQQCLKEYAERDYTPPEWGEPFAPLEEGKKGSSNTGKAMAETDCDAISDKKTTDDNDTAIQQSPVTATKTGVVVAKTGNFVFKRPVDSVDEKNKSTRTTSSFQVR